MEEIIKSLKEQIANSDALGYDRDQASWGYEQGILLTVEEAEKIVNQLSHPLEARVSGREIFDYNEHFTKWNKNNESYFSDFVLWCIHATQGQELVKKVARQ